MARVMINTSDTAWIERHAAESDVIPYGTDTRGVMYFQVDVEVANVQHITFAAAKMIRFDLADRPADHARAGAMYPESYLLNG